ncbi:hypothetical protein C8J57DRAFT_1179212 [Mycena rebaudengoi]|nr:hypothetical protein C8J57DRAFT_1179212 [Mycena rebaudengoi]
MSSATQDTASPLQRVVSPTPSAKKRFTALQRIKKLGGKLKRSKKGDKIPEESELAEDVPVAVEENVDEAPQLLLESTVDSAQLPFETPEPDTLAQRIRALITSLPNGSVHPPVKADPPPLDPDGRPIPPPSATPIKDPKLIALLSDPEFMNGSLDDGRPSVWAALEALDAPKYRKPTSSDDAPGQSDGEPGDDDVQALGDVMLYCPLFPTDESKVELAKTNTIEVPLTKVDTLWQSRWNFLWSMTVGLVKQPPPQTKVVTTWVPSKTKISFQAMWWGYRMYLPPPVMAELNEDEAEVVKIATTITGALTWFLANISPAAVPPPLLPAFLLLQKLGPYVGYIGTFISWIWGAIQGADKGLGVTLTATWLLPVALIPSAIKAPEADAPPPTTPDAPVPAPPADTPATTVPPTTTPPTTTVPAADPLPTMPTLST